MTSSRVFVVSLGNPKPYLNTLHSAGHSALEALRRELALPPFATRRIAKQSSKVSASNGRYTLLQSPTLMNISGPWVARAWREGKEESTGEFPGLVVIHDDLEEELGVVKIRAWDRSHRGHNGLKSINGSLRRSDYKSSGKPRWAKISVGIGRPATRDQASVSDYVLRPMTSREQQVLEQETGPGVLAALKQVEAQWAAEEAAELQKEQQKEQQRLKKLQKQEQKRQQQLAEAAGTSTAATEEAAASSAQPAEPPKSKPKSKRAD